MNYIDIHYKVDHEGRVITDPLPTENIRNKFGKFGIARIMSKTDIIQREVNNLYWTIHKYILENELGILPVNVLKDIAKLKTKEGQKNVLKKWTLDQLGMDIHGEAITAGYSLSGADNDCYIDIVSQTLELYKDYGFDINHFREEQNTVRVMMGKEPI